MAENSREKDENLQNDQDNSLSSIVQNMALAHEMAMDEKFKLNEEPSHTLKGQIKQIVHKAFWDSIEEELNKDPPNYEPAIRLLSELKETLLSVLFDHNVKLREQINNVLDVELIAQQSAQDSVDIQGYGCYVIDVMSKICTPERDEEIEKLKKVEGLVPLFREIFRVLDLMKMDMANFFLSQIRPQVVQQSVEIEQNKFREYLNENPNGLLSTKKWIKCGMDAARVKRDEQTQNHCDESDGKTSSETGVNASCCDVTRNIKFDISEVVKHGYGGIVLAEGDFPYPETLLMDQQRMVAVRHWMQCLVKLASVLVVTLNMVGKHLASDAEYKKKLKENILLLLKGTKDSQSVFPNIAEQVVKDTTTFLTKRGLSAFTEENMNNIKLQINNLEEDSHTIRQLLRKRVADFLLSNILPTESTLGACPTALLEIEAEFNEFIQQFSHIVSHNFLVFKPFYEEILQELA